MLKHKNSKKQALGISRKTGELCGVGKKKWEDFPLPSLLLSIFLLLAVISLFLLL
jgi:hypothetical protein